MGYLKNPTAITVIAAGAAILAGAVVSGRAYPGAFVALGIGWLIVAAVAVVSIRRSRNG